MIYLHIIADFDENGLERKTYTSIDELIENSCDEFNTYQEILDHLKECAESGEDPEYQAEYYRDLVESGEVIGEWFTEMFFSINGTVTDGV